MKAKSLYPFLTFLLVCTPPLPAQAPPSAPPADIDGYIARVLDVFEVPGLALVIVKDGGIAMAKGYGRRELGSEGTVDAGTLFAIASNTKAFTATALALLVEEGKVDWDAAVIRYLPWFRMSDPYVTSELTVRDLLVHRSGLGLGAGDLLWWPPSSYDRQEIARRLRFIRLANSFRSAYAYDNVLYLVAGELIEAVSGRTWEDFVATRILARVGMSGSAVSYVDALQHGNVATPHARIAGEVRPVDPFASDNTNPAGGIVASATDMAKWMIVQLDSGRVAQGARLFTPRSARELWTAVTPIPIGDPPPELAALRMNFHGYALGFRVHDYRGYKVVTHTGGLPGYVSKVAMIPDLKLGVAVLTNMESAAAFESVVYRVLDHYLAAPETDWVAAYRAVGARRDSTIAAEDARSAAQRDTSSRPSLPLEAYAGDYTDAWYGDVSIALEDGGLVIRFSHTPALTGDLEHWQHDTFVARWRDRELRADAFVTFALNPDGSIERVKMRPVSRSTDFSFDFQDLLLKPAANGAGG